MWLAVRAAWGWIARVTVTARRWARPTRLVPLSQSLFSFYFFFFLLRFITVKRAAASPPNRLCADGHVTEWRRQPPRGGARHPLRWPPRGGRRCLQRQQRGARARAPPRQHRTAAGGLERRARGPHRCAAALAHLGRPGGGGGNASHPRSRRPHRPVAVTAAQRDRLLVRRRHRRWAPPCQWSGPRFSVQRRRQRQQRWQQQRRQPHAPPQQRRRAPPPVPPPPKRLRPSLPTGLRSHRVGGAVAVSRQPSKKSGSGGGRGWRWSTRWPESLPPPATRGYSHGQGARRVGCRRRDLPRRPGHHRGGH